MTHPAIAYAESFLGVPYVYDGKNRLQGLDCSGLVCEVLKSFDLLRYAEDLNAQMLYDRFSKYESLFPAVPIAALIFFGKSKKDIHHVALSVDGLRMIEAGGGDQTCKDFHRAAMVGAMVRERPIAMRKDRVAVCVPPWPKIDG